MKNNKKTLLWILVGGLVLFFAFSFISSNSVPNAEEAESVKQIKIAGQMLNAEVADTPEARTQGLSNRTEFRKEDSLLFVFDTPGMHAFWMKDMNFPIDMIWIGEDLRVVHIKENATPESYPENFRNDKPAKYVLETVAGFSRENGLKVGDKVEFDF